MRSALLEIGLIFALLSVPVYAVALDPPSSPPSQGGVRGGPGETAKPETPKNAKVSIEAKDTKVKDVLDSLSKQSKEKFVVESTVKGTVATLSLKDVSLESALATVCKSAKIEWRKICISPDSKLLEQPDRLAATVRLMSGLSFPDMVLAGSSTNKIGAHFEDKKAVSDAEESAIKTLGMTKVYLITNDAAVAAKALANDNQNKKNEATDKYMQMAKDQMDIFMKMTPEEREQALLASINLVDQADPRYMSTVMQTLMNSDPENLKRMLAKQTQVMFDMSQEERRAIIKLNMQLMNSMPPELMKLLQEDSLAVVEELKASGELPDKP